MTSHPVIVKVRHALHRLGVQGRVLVALSGGPDSVALLRALTLTLQPQNVQAAHLNHLLRGEESDGDEQFVRELCESLRVTLHCERLDVSSHALSESENLEKAARELRYGWLARVAGEAGVPCVITGHSADDQAETLLHRLMRGAGLKGLRGIAPRRVLAPGVELARPMLEATRTEVLDFLQQLGQAHRLDRTNLDTGRTRSRIRHELLPMLARDFNPEIVSVLCRLAAQAEEAFQEVEEQACELRARVERPRAGNLLIFDRAGLSAAPPNAVRELFRSIWDREGWPQSDMNAEHWDRLARLARGELRAVDLPGKITARLQERVVQIERMHQNDRG